MSETFVPDHLHMIVKGYIKNAPKKEETDIFLTDLVKRVGMKVLLGPTSGYVYDKGNEGATGTITLYTSHASIHVWDAEKPYLFQFDIYSCKPFNPEQVFACLDDHFKLIKAKYLLIDRNGEDFIIKKGDF